MGSNFLNDGGEAMGQYFLFKKEGKGDFVAPCIPLRMPGRVADDQGSLGAL